MPNHSPLITRHSDISVLILGAGLGTRLRPLTNNTPKVMLEIAPGLPLLGHTITLLKNQGFRNFIINLHYLPEKITSYFGDGRKWGVNVEYSDETEKLMDTGGAIKKVENKLSDPFLFLFGDELHFVNFVEMLEFHREKKAYGTIVMSRGNIPQNGDVAELDETGKIVKWRVRPHDITEFGPNQYVNGGLYVLPREITDFIPEGIPYNLDRQVIKKLFDEGRNFYGFVPGHDVQDIGSQKNFEDAKKWYLQELEKRKSKLKDYSWGIQM